MVEESTLKIELAKLQAEITGIESDLANLQRVIDRAAVMLEASKTKAIEESKSAFNLKREQDVRAVEQKCSEMFMRADELLDTFPGLKSKEYAGRFEVKSLEAKLEELYPAALLSSYVCIDPIEFKDEGDAYSAYTRLERRITNLKQSSAASAIFSGLNSMMMAVCKKDGMAGKVALGVIGLLCFSFVFSPFLFLTVFSLIGLVSAVQGAYVHQLLRYLYSIKSFLNETYDEDIFQEDKQDILVSVKSFLDEIQSEYVSKIRARVFKMNPAVIADLEKNSKSIVEKAQNSIEGKQNLLDVKRKEVAAKLAQLDSLEKRKEEEAQAARKRYLETIDWKYEWPNQVLVDVTANSRVLGATWNQCNTLYYSNDIRTLEKFWQLAIYQMMLRMPPDYCGQVVLDYIYMGSNLLQFSKVPASMFTLCADEEAIKQKVDRMKEDIHARIGNILKSCENIEAFNDMMKTYGSTGEAYVIVHICGLKSITADLCSFLKNGPKVGYFFKIYLTSEELKALGKEIPFEDVREYAEVSDVVTPRTLSAIQRMVEAGA